MKKKIIIILLLAASLNLITGCSQTTINQKPIIISEQTPASDSGFTVFYQGENFEVQIQKVLTQKASKDFIKAYDTFTGRKTETPIDSHWQIIEIKTINESTLIPNFHLVNADGSDFSFGDIEYSQNVFSVNYNSQEYLAFLIPNGCKEYSINVQDQINITIKESEKDNA